MVASVGKAPSESLYDAPASIFSILDHISDRQIPDTVPEECSSTASSSSSSHSSRLAGSTVERRVILPDTCSENSSSVEEAGRQLMRYWPSRMPTYPVMSKQILPVYVFPKNYKRVHVKELVLHKGSALRDLVVFMGLLTLVVVIGAVFTAVYFGFDW